MHLAVLVKGHGVLLQPAGDHIVVDDHGLARGQRLVDEVEDVEQLAGIAAAVAQQGRGLLHPHLEILEHGIGLHGMVEQLEQVVLVERVEHIDLGTREQGTYDLKRGILGRGAYERDRAVLDGAQQRVLLRLVETVYLVDKQNGAAFGKHTLGVLLATFEHIAHLLDAAGHGRERVEGHLSVLGNDARQRGLAHSRRPPQDKRRDIAALYHAAYHGSWPHQVLLAYVVVECLRPQALGQWLIIHFRLDDLEERNYYLIIKKARIQNIILNFTHSATLIAAQLRQ